MTPVSSTTSMTMTTKDLTPDSGPVAAFREYLAVHSDISLGGHALDKMALELARIALDFQAEPAAVDVPDGWKLVPATLTQNMADAATTTDRRLSVWKYADVYAAMLANAPDYPALAATPGAAAAPVMPDFCHVASLKLKSLQERGYQITGYALEKPVEGALPDRGFINHGGFVGWWSDAPRQCGTCSDHGAVGNILTAEPCPDCSKAQVAAQDSIRELLAKHSAELEHNHYAYFELAYTRRTGWMAWITDKPLNGGSVINPDRKVLAQGQGDTPEAACAAAIAAQAPKEG